jgi:glycosyltransferase involved in cell wall biosynthesis
MTQRRIKVALIHNILSPYNIPLYVEMIRSERIELKILVTHITKEGANDRLEFMHTTPRAGYLRRWGDRQGIALPDFKMIRAVCRYQPDAILTDGLSSVGTTVWIYATMSRKVHIFWWSFGAIPGRRMSLRTAFGDMIQRFCIRRSAGVIAYGTHGAEFYRRMGFPSDGITVGYNTIDETQIQDDMLRLAHVVPELRVQLGLGAAPVAIFCGTMKQGKRVDLLLRSFAQCRKKSGPVAPMLVLIGDGPDLDSMRQMAQAIGLEGDTRFVGRQDRDISAYFLLGQFVVLPGLGGLAINHAFAHGLPVICGPADGCELDLVKTGMTGILLSEVSEENLAESMADLFRRPDHCARMGRAARELVLKDISLANYARRVELAVLNSFTP